MGSCNKPIGKEKKKKRTERRVFLTFEVVLRGIYIFLQIASGHGPSIQSEVLTGDKDLSRASPLAQG